MALVAIPNIPPLVIPPPPGNPRVFISELTGAGPWTWTGLNGDAAGVRGYEIVFKTTKAALGAHNLAIRFNGDTGANYMDPTGVAATSARLSAGFGGFNETINGTVWVPYARSGAPRTITGLITVDENTGPSTYRAFPDSSWRSNAAITQIDVINSAGAVDAGVFALYELMDVP